MHTAISEEDVRHRAYLLWEAEGRLSGRDEHYWYLASSQLSEESASSRPGATVEETKQTKPVKAKSVRKEQTSKSVCQTSGNEKAGAEGDDLSCQRL
jgi:hypothetical protein